MARKLTASQKKVLDNSNANHWDALSPAMRDQLERMNDYETLWSDVSRYLGDRAMSTAHCSLW